MLDTHPAHVPAGTWREFFVLITTIVLGTLIAFASAGCARPPIPNAIVGAWFVKIPAAPYPYHLFIFHADGTVIQSNPDSGDPRNSDSNLVGAWTSAADGHVTAKLVETSADRSTHKFVSRTELTMSLQVQFNSLHGTGTALAFNATGKSDGKPLPFTFDGDRILP